MKSSNFKCLVAVATVLALAVPAQLSAQDQSAKHHHYKLIDLGTLGGPNGIFQGFTKPINNHGTISGFADTFVLDPNFPNVNPFFFTSPPGADPYIQQAYKWKNGARTELTALPGATSSGPQWMNERGDIVGASTNGLIDPLTGFQEINAVLWNRNGRIRNLGTLGGNESIAYGINDSGQVAGGALNTIPDPFTSAFVLWGATQVHAFLWQKGVMQDLGTLGGPDSMAFSINERGLLSGMAATNSVVNPTTGLPTIDPFIWEDDHMVDLGSFGGTFGIANALNNRGQVVGTSDLSGDDAWHAFLWTKSKGMQDLGTLGGFASEANAINDAGDAVGVSFLAGDEVRNHAVLWKKGKIIDLGVVAGDICTFAFWVNSKVQVVGFSNRDDCGGSIHTAFCGKRVLCSTSTHWFLPTPA